MPYTLLHYQHMLTNAIRTSLMSPPAVTQTPKVTSTNLASAEDTLDDVDGGRD
jgi:hypothetical protein